jgi:4-hydroxy-tetrahydrodipicolinate reductase
MINGLPGNVAKVITRHAMQDPRVDVLPYALTGPDIDAAAVCIEDTDIELIQPKDRNERIQSIVAREGDLICVDFTHPLAVNDNAQFYAQLGLPFVMGTTGGDRQALTDAVSGSSISAVIAPNMAKQIVGFQALMAYAAETFPSIFKGYSLTIRESHQAGKADTSGTAKAMVQYFNKMGIPFGEDQIEKERDPERQSNMWGVPPEFLNGHAWHTYTLVSGDKTTRFEFTHNVNGRDIYGEGTLDAIAFLARKLAAGSKGEVFSMIDVLKAGAGTK